MSQPRFDVATSFLLSVIDSWSQLPFSCCDLKLFVCSLSYHDMGFRLRPNRFFSLLKLMSRPQKHVVTSFLLILPQPHFLVTTVSSVQLIFMSRHEFLVATSIVVSNLYFCRNLKLPCRDLTSPFNITSWSRHPLSVVTHNVSFSCRDLKMMSRHDLP